MAAESSQKLDRFVVASAAVIETLSAESRLKLLEILAEVELSVGALSRLPDANHDTLRTHLSEHGNEGVDGPIGMGQAVPYTFRSDAVMSILRLLESIFDERRS